MVAPRPVVGFVGAGKVASVLAAALRDAGYRVAAVASRSSESARSLAARLPGCEAVSPQQVVDRCDLVFVTTPDAAIEPVASSLVWRAGIAAVHSSGLQTRVLLAAAARGGASTGSLHPLQTFAGGDACLRGCTFAVEAEPDLEPLLLRLVEDLGGTPLRISARDKALYHASAVIASNYLVTLAWLAAGLWRRFGVERPDALRALLPLMRGALANLDSLGLPAALTGPIARGDIDSVRHHLESLQEAEEDALAAYRAMGLATLALAQAQVGLDEEARTAIEALLAAGNIVPATYEER